MKSYICTCGKNAYHEYETEKAIGFEKVTGLSHANSGRKYFPKSKIKVDFEKYANTDRVEIIIPLWLFNDISKNVILTDLEIDGYME